MTELESTRLQQHPGPGAEDTADFMAAFTAGIAEITGNRKTGFQQMTADLMEPPGGGNHL